MKLAYSILFLAGLAVCSSCSNDDDSVKQPSQGHPVTLSLGVPTGDDTRVAHSLNGTSIHPVWAAGDQVEVVYTKDGAEVSETFTLSSGTGEQTGAFTCESSQLEEGTAYEVYYPAKSYDLSTQDGTLENLPEYLYGSASSLTAGVKLQSKLTYFHFVFTGNYENSVSSQRVYLEKSSGNFSMYKQNTTTTFYTLENQTTPFAVNSNTNLDFYIATRLDGNTSGGAMKLWISPLRYDFFGISYTVPNYYYSWNISKDYEAGKVYKVTGSLSYTPAPSGDAW